MAEVAAATPTDAAPEVASFDDKLANMLGTAPTPEADTATATPEVTAEGELSAADVEALDPEVVPEGEWLELDRKGEKRKVSKEEAKRLAQQGWDYSTNQESLKADRRTLENIKGVLQAKAQLIPMVIDAAANVRMYERALQQPIFQTMPALAQSDPLQYIQVRAQYDQYMAGYQQSYAEWQKADGAVKQVDHAILASDVQQNLGRVFEAMPDLRDPQKFTQEQGRIRAYLKKEGISDQEADSLVDSRHFVIAHKAMRYDQAMAAKSERSKPNSPSLSPGAAPQRQTAKIKEQELVKQLHRAKPENKKAAFDAALAAKLAKFG